MYVCDEEGDGCAGMESENKMFLQHLRNIKDENKKCTQENAQQKDCSNDEKNSKPHLTRMVRK